MNYDLIVIGGGLGGLIAGAKLSKEGKKVLLLEQHDRPGGCATTFERKDYTMEVGLHEMDGLHPTDMKNKIFDDLGLGDDVKFLPLPEFFRFNNGRTDLIMPHTKEEAVSVLKERFPDQSEGIDKYFERLMNCKRINVIERKQPDISIGEYLDHVFTNEELKLVLLGNLGYFHDDPYTLSLRYFSVAESAYFHGRANYIQGGSQQLSNRLMKIIQENNGTVLLNHLVLGIEVKEGRVNSISYKKKLGKVQAIETATADLFIANAALPVIADMMSDNTGSKLKQEIAVHTYGASLLTVYFGFSKSLKELASKNYSTFVYDESVKTQKDILSNNHADFDKRSFTFVDYSQVDSQIAPEGKSVGSICCVDYLEDWDKLNKEDYKTKKASVTAMFADRIDKLIPGSKAYIEHIEIGTSKSVQRYTLNPNGAVYGFAQHPNRIPISTIPDVDNMYIASAWGRFGGGFSGAIFSGYMTAMDVLRRK